MTTRAKTPQEERQDERLRAEVARLVTKHREKAGLNRNQLMVASGVTSAAISNIEKGIGAPRLDTLQKLARALKVSTRELVPK